MANSIISKVYLLDTPLKNDYKDTFYFASESAQQTYFQSKIKHTFDNVSYLRKENVIKVNKQYDSICTCNYLMYQNTGYSNKWIYCFIKDMRYISDGCTEIEIETDVIQTWLFNYQLNQSFVEREHVSDDTIGIHTIPEKLETGDYVCLDTKPIESGAFCFVLASTRDYLNNFKKIGGKIYNGIYSGLKYFAFWTSSDLEGALEEYDKEGYGEDIYCIFVMPTSLIGNAKYNSEEPVVAIPESVGSVECGSATISRPTKLDGYTPRNKKLLTYPYQYLLVDNSCGSSCEFLYELFQDPSHCGFNIQGSITPGISRILIPECYAYGNNVGVESDLINHALSLGKFPICNWNSDVYTNWLTQNGVNTALSYSSSILAIAGGVGAMSTGVGALTGAGMIAGGVLGIANTMGQSYERSFSPNQSKGNINSGDVITSMHANMPIFHYMSIKSEYAKKIDKFFDLFGYQVNELKVPNKNHREQWWFTKTDGANITGAVPGNDLQKIKDCYNQGITFWKNPANIYNYSLSNSII